MRTRHPWREWLRLAARCALIPESGRCSRALRLCSIATRRGAIHGRHRQPRAGDLAPAPPTPTTSQHQPRPQPLPAASRRAVRQCLACSETVRHGVSRLGFLRSMPRRSATGPLSELAEIPQRCALRRSPATRPHNRSIAIPAAAGNLSSLLELRCGGPHRLVQLCGPSWARWVSLLRSSVTRLRCP